MPRSQLPLLTSAMMLVQAFVAAPAGLKAKGSIRSRNQVLLLGYAAMIAADLTFAFVPTVTGRPAASTLISEAHFNVKPNLVLTGLAFLNASLPLQSTLSKLEALHDASDSCKAEQPPSQINFSKLRVLYLASDLCKRRAAAAKQFVLALLTCSCLQACSVALSLWVCTWQPHTA